MPNIRRGLGLKVDVDGIFSIAQIGLTDTEHAALKNVFENV